jgi:hypothetical protein
MDGTYYPAASLYTLPSQAEGATVTFNFGGCPCNSASLPATLHCGKGSLEAWWAAQARISAILLLRWRAALPPGLCQSSLATLQACTHPTSHAGVGGLPACPVTAASVHDVERLLTIFLSWCST